MCLRCMGTKGGGGSRTYTSQGPEEILVLLLVGDENLAVGSYHLDLEHVVCSETVRWAENTMAAAGDISSDTHALRTTTHNSRAVLVSELVNIVHCRPAADGDGIALNDCMTAVLLVFGEREGALVEGK
jgi:hypothetical protein